MFRALPGVPTDPAPKLREVEYGIGGTKLTNDDFCTVASTDRASRSLLALGLLSASSSCCTYSTYIRIKDIEGKSEGYVEIRVIK